jgi:Xaa-Pro aminopeptidase
MTAVDTRTPPFADFPTDEYRARVQRAQRIMRAEGLDVVILTQRENVEYFSGFLTGHWVSKTFATAALLLHHDRDPVLVIPQFFGGTAAGSSWVTDLVMFPECHAAPREFPSYVVQAVQKLRATTGVIGLESGDNLVSGWNLTDYHKMRDGLRGVDFRSAANVIWGCRAYKSPRELDRMRQLTQMTDRAIRAAHGNARAGVTEIDIANWLSVSGTEQGADRAAFLNIRAGLPRYPCADSIPVARPLERGDMLLIDAGLNKNLYTTDVAYVSHVGTPPDEHRRFYDAVIRSHEALLAALRPGVPANEVYEAGRKPLADFGNGRYIDMMGHGIGLDIHEPPIITPYERRTIEAGMTFAIEPWLYDTDRLGFFCVEEIVHVTEDGCEIFSTLPRDELWTVEA